MKRDSKQTFSIRKYSIGAASVLIGAAILAGGGTAQADEVVATTAAPAGTEASTNAATTADLVTSTITDQSAASVTTSASDAVNTTSSVAVANQASAEATSSVATPALATRSAEAVTTAAAPVTNVTADVVTADPHDAKDAMPTGELTDLSQVARQEESDLVVSEDNLSGNQAQAATLPSGYESMAVNEDNKRVATIVAVSGRDGQTDERYYSLVAALDSTNYEVREYNRQQRLLNTVALATNDKKIFYPAGGRTADRPKFTVITDEQGARIVFDRARNWKNSNKYAIRTVYSTLVNPVIPANYGGAENSQTNFDQFTQNLPFASEVKVNYVVRGTGEQIADSNIISTFVNDSYKTVAAGEADFYDAFKNQGYTLVESPTYKDGKINATYWGGKGFVAVNDVTNTVAGITRDLRVRRTVINDQGDIVIEAWDKASGVKLPIQRYTKTNGEVVNLSGYNTYVSEAIRPSDSSLSSDALYKEVAFAFADEQGVMFYSNDSQTRYSQADIARNPKLAGGTRLSSWTSSWQPAAAEINYVYAKTKANVTASYINTDGTQIKDSQLVAALATIGSSYNADTPNLKPSRITTADNKVYVLVSQAGVTTNGLVYGADGVVTGQGYAPVTGTVAENDQVITFVYQLDKQTAIVKYVNETDGKELDRDAISGVAGEAINYSTGERIKTYEAAGYALVSDGFTSASNKVFDNDPSVDQEYVVVLKERVVPVGPNDPDPQPEQPVTPEDPAKWPKQAEEVGQRRRRTTQTINYRREEDGKEVYKPVRRTIDWERTFYVNLVTGAVTSDPWKPVNVHDEDIDDTPLVNTSLRSAGVTGFRSAGATANAPRLVTSAATSQVQPLAATAEVTSRSKAASKPVLRRQAATRRVVRR